MTTTAHKLLLLGQRRGLTAYQRYINDLIALSPLALWPLSEQSGAVAHDISGNGLHGTYISTSLDAIKFPDGSPSPLFASNSARVTLPLEDLDDVFDPAHGTLLFWYKVRTASVWTDGVARFPLSFGADASNRIFPTKSSSNNLFQWSYRGAGTVEIAQATSYSPSRWIAVALTWDATEDVCRFYLDGAHVLTSNTLGTWSGALNPAFTCIGNLTAAGGANHADGYVKYVTLWDHALPEGDILALMPQDFLA